MRNLYRPICLMALLAVAPTVLIGCSGGSSSNNSSSTQSATFSFNTLENVTFLPTVNVRGNLKPPMFPNGLPDTSKGKGIYTFSYQATGEAQGTQTLTTVANFSNSKEFRIISIARNTTTGFDGPVGTVYQSDSNPYLNVDFYKGLKKGEIPQVADYVLTDGTVTVTANDGKNVTLRLDNVEVINIVNGAPEPKTIRLSGSITYDQSKIERSDFVLQPGDTPSDAIRKSLKN